MQHCIGQNKLCTYTGPWYLHDSRPVCDYCAGELEVRHQKMNLGTHTRLGACGSFSNAAITSYAKDNFRVSAISYDQGSHYRHLCNRAVRSKDYDMCIIPVAQGVDFQFHVTPPATRKPWKSKQYPRNEFRYMVRFAVGDKEITIPKVYRKGNTLLNPPENTWDGNPQWITIEVTLCTAHYSRVGDRRPAWYTKHETQKFNILVVARDVHDLRDYSCDTTVWNYTVREMLLKYMQRACIEAGGVARYQIDRCAGSFDDARSGSWFTAGKKIICAPCAKHTPDSTALLPAMGQSIYSCGNSNDPDFCGMYVNGFHMCVSDLAHRQTEQCRRAEHHKKYNMMTVELSKGARYMIGIAPPHGSELMYSLKMRIGNKEVLNPTKRCMGNQSFTAAHPYDGTPTQISVEITMYKPHDSFTPIGRVPVATYVPAERQRSYYATIMLIPEGFVDLQDHGGTESEWKWFMRKLICQTMTNEYKSHLLHEQLANHPPPAATRDDNVDNTVAHVDSDEVKTDLPSATRDDNVDNTVAHVDSDEVKTDSPAAARGDNVDGDSVMDVTSDDTDADSSVDAVDKRVVYTEARRPMPDDEPDDFITFIIKTINEESAQKPAKTRPSRKEAPDDEAEEPPKKKVRETSI